MVKGEKELTEKVPEEEFKMFVEKRIREDLKKALVLVKELRIKALALHLDPRAVRIALKFALMLDDYYSAREISPEEDEQLTRIAEDLFQKTPKRIRY